MPPFRAFYPSWAAETVQALLGLGWRPLSTPHGRLKLLVASRTTPRVMYFLPHGRLKHWLVEQHTILGFSFYPSWAAETPSHCLHRSWGIVLSTPHGRLKRGVSHRRFSSWQSFYPSWAAETRPLAPGELVRTSFYPSWAAETPERCGSQHLLHFLPSWAAETLQSLCV